MNNKLRSLELREVRLMLMVFIGFLPAIIFLYLGVYPLNIFMKADKYKIGKFFLKDLDCGTGYESEDFNCYGHGTINNRKTSVNLGKTPGITSIYNNPNYADLSSDTIAVFYRPSLRQTIVVRNNEKRLNKNKYLYKGVKNLIYPLIIFLYRKTKKQLKQLKNEEKTS